MILSSQPIKRSRTASGNALPGLILAGAGTGSAIVSAVALAQLGVEPRDAGAAGALDNVARQLGAALGIAVISTFVATPTATTWPTTAAPGSTRRPASLNPSTRSSAE